MSHVFSCVLEIGSRSCIVKLLEQTTRLNHYKPAPVWGNLASLFYNIFTILYTNTDPIPNANKKYHIILAIVEKVPDDVNPTGSGGLCLCTNSCELGDGI